MPLGASDIGAILSDLKALGEAVDVVKGGTTVQGIFRQDQELLTGEGQVERIPVVEIKTGAIATLAIDDSLTVGGTGYTVRDFWPGDDAGMTRVVLAP